MASTLQDEIRFRPSMPPSDRKKILIFMITGNPGLIEYYRDFLASLHARINSISEPHADAQIYGASLQGFKINGTPLQNGPLNLDQQIESVTARLVRIAQEITESEARNLPIILIGHSVGSYILLETLHRMQTTMQTTSKLNIVSGICLFPTIVDIAKSPTGRKMTPFLLLPGFALAIHLLSKALFSLLPLSIMIPLVQLATGMPSHSATTTAAFLKSLSGVRQALHMAKHEMLEIGADDRWSDHLWGANAKTMEAAAAEAGGKQTQLYFYWGEKDHWVADETRDVLLRTRAGTSAGGHERGPRMEVDAKGTPHGFCVRGESSRVVAEKVAGWVHEVVNGLDW